MPTRQISSNGPKCTAKFPLHPWTLFQIQVHHRNTQMKTHPLLLNQTHEFTLNLKIFRDWIILVHQNPELLQPLAFQSPPLEVLSSRLHQRTSKSITWIHLQERAVATWWSTNLKYGYPELEYWMAMRSLIMVSINPVSKLQNFDQCWNCFGFKVLWFFAFGLLGLKKKRDL